MSTNGFAQGQSAQGPFPQGQFPVGQFTPDPRPSAPARMITASAGLELRLTLRNGEQLLLALIIPLAALIGGTFVTVIALPEPRIDSVTPGVLALAVLSTAFTSQAITTGFDRRYGVLKRLAAAGMSRPQLIAGKASAALAVVAGQFVVLGGVALALGWHPEGSPLWLLVVTVLGTAALLGLALLLGGTLRAEGVLALANIIWLVMVVLGGVVVPLSSAPAWLQTVGELTPVGALSQSLRAILESGQAPSRQSLAVLAGWLVLGWAGTVRWFRWQ